MDTTTIIGLILLAGGMLTNTMATPAYYSIDSDGIRTDPLTSTEQAGTLVAVIGAILTLVGVLT